MEAMVYNAMMAIWWILNLKESFAVYIYVTLHAKIQLKKECLCPIKIWANNW